MDWNCAWRKGLCRWRIILLSTGERGWSARQSTLDTALRGYHLFQVFNALPRDALGAGLEVECLDREPAVVADLPERRDDRLELHLAHPGAQQVGVVHLHVGD